MADPTRSALLQIFLAVQDLPSVQEMFAESYSIEMLRELRAEATALQLEPVDLPELSEQQDTPNRRVVPRREAAPKRKELHTLLRCFASGKITGVQLHETLMEESHELLAHHIASSVGWTPPPKRRNTMRV